MSAGKYQHKHKNGCMPTAQRFAKDPGRLEVRSDKTLHRQSRECQCGEPQARTISAAARIAHRRGQMRGSKRKGGVP